MQVPMKPIFFWHDTPLFSLVSNWASKQTKNLNMKKDGYLNSMSFDKFQENNKAPNKSNVNDFDNFH